MPIGMRKSLFRISMNTYQVELPISPSLREKLQIGDKLLLNGELFTARDAAHRRIVESLSNGIKLPFNLATLALFYCGPSPAPPGKVCGAIGPTTSTRMDTYLPFMIEHGLRVTIGKGNRSPEAEKLIRESGSLYLVCVGGASAYLSQHIVSCETFLWPDLGAEAIYRLVAKDFPIYVSIV